uniref:energy transducer TonB n=1 Tax=Gluconobacter thailandicus TaxID=257438 RepID=UPI0038D0D443
MDAFERGETAKTEVSCDISKADVPSNSHIVKSNNPHFNASAIEFVQRIHYVPARRNGKILPSPITSNTLILRFKATAQTPSTITTL